MLRFHRARENRFFKRNGGFNRMMPRNLLVLSIALSMAASPQPARAQAGPDELAEAARLASHAQTLEDGCRYHESADWLAKAIDRLKHLHSTDAAQSRAAGSMLAQLEIRQSGVKQQ